MQAPLQTEHDIRQRIWAELQRAVHDRHHEWRTPVLATVAPDGTPQARTVVLRQATAQPACITFYTDSRSPKVAELMAAPHASFVFWSKRLSWQLRVQTHVSVQTTGSHVDDVWERMRQSPAAGDYLAASAPGALLASEPTPEQALHDSGQAVAANNTAIDNKNNAADCPIPTEYAPQGVTQSLLSTLDSRLVPAAQLHHHLAVITAQVTTLDWLELARSGHRRAVLTDAGFEWRVP